MFTDIHNECHFHSTLIEQFIFAAFVVKKSIRGAVVD